MINLIIDTSSEYCSITLDLNGNITQFHKLTPRKHNEFLLPEIKNLLDNANCKISQLDYISYGQGAGSFVGVRLSASVVQGLSFPYKIPVIGFSSMFLRMLTLVHNHNYIKTAICILDAKMGDLYIGEYIFENDKWNITKEYSKTLLEIDNDFISDIIFGDGVLLIDNKYIKSNEIISEVIYPDTVNIVNYLSIENSKSAIEVQPIYLQGTKQWKKLST